ncbi:MAG: gamma carbonic anhydrase family protein [Halanaeroarchaeum sp.]
MNGRTTYGFQGTVPDVHDGANVSPEATLVGDVTVEADATVWPGVVIRGDMGSVAIGAGSHVGDNATIHDSSIGAGVMVGHGAIINEATVGDRSLVGFNATVNTDVAVGESSVIAAGTTIQEGREVPAESFVRGVPATVTPLAETSVDPSEIFASYSPERYSSLADRHDELFE